MIDFRLYANLAAHPFDQVFADRKAEPDALLILVPVFLEFGEVDKQFSDAFLRHSAAKILDYQVVVYVMGESVVEQDTL